MQFFGERCQRTFTIFNNGPTDAKFLISYGSVAEMKPKAEDDGTAGCAS